MFLFDSQIKFSVSFYTRTILIVIYKIILILFYFFLRDKLDIKRSLSLLKFSKFKIIEKIFLFDFEEDFSITINNFFLLLYLI